MGGIIDSYKYFPFRTPGSLKPSLVFGLGLLCKKCKKKFSLITAHDCKLNFMSAVRNQDALRLSMRSIIYHDSVLPHALL